MTAATLMRSSLFLVLLATVPHVAAAPTCELAILKAETISDLGRAATETQNFYDAQTLAADARIPAMDGAKQSALCGCPEAAQFFIAAKTASERVNVTQFLEAMKSYGMTIRENGDKALAALRACSAR